MTINTDFTYLSTILDPSPDLWEICEDVTIDWKGLAEQNIVNYNEIFNYDGMLYCLSLLHQKLFFDRQQIRKEDEYTEYDQKIFALGRLSRQYRQSIN
jgi:hypothetical protein